MTLSLPNVSICAQRAGSWSSIIDHRLAMIIMTCHEILVYLGIIACVPNSPLQVLYCLLTLEPDNAHFVVSSLHLKTQMRCAILKQRLTDKFMSVPFAPQSTSVVCCRVAYALRDQK